MYVAGLDTRSSDIFLVSFGTSPPNSHLHVCAWSVSGRISSQLLQDEKRRKYVQLCTH